MEGVPVQELSAIQMNAGTRQIVDVYHAHAEAQTSDIWSRRHIHGLNTIFLKRCGFRNENILFHDFHKWLRGKDVLAMFANNPRKESLALKLNIKDMNIPSWSQRAHLSSHEVALRYKNEFIPILDTRCCAEAHSAFESYPLLKTNDSEIAKRNFGFHCSLYDAYELYLCYIMN